MILWASHHTVLVFISGFKREKWNKFYFQWRETGEIGDIAGEGIDSIMAKAVQTFIENSIKKTFFLRKEKKNGDNSLS